MSWFKHREISKEEIKWKANLDWEKIDTDYKTNKDKRADMIWEAVVHKIGQELSISDNCYVKKYLLTEKQRSDLIKQLQDQCDIFVGYTDIRISRKCN